VRAIKSAFAVGASAPAGIPSYSAEPNFSWRAGLTGSTSIGCGNAQAER
jgi:hypothetical protein